MSDAAFSPKIVRGRLYEQVAEQIQEWILSGKIEVGSQLAPERELVEMFGVSRIVIREAARVLAGRGLLSVEPGRGSFVQRPEPEAAADSISALLQARRDTEENLHEVRLPLEIAMAGLAAGRATPDRLQKMRAALEEMDDSVDDPSGYVEATWPFIWRWQKQPTTLSFSSFSIRLSIYCERAGG